MPKILVKKRAEILAEYRFSRKPIVNIGSSKGNDIIIIDKSISEYHCAIMRKENTYEIKDKNTLTGTKVNDRAVTEQVLQPGDIVNIGLHTIELRLDAKDGRERQGAAAGGIITISALKIFILLGVYGKFEGKKYEINPDGETYVGRENISPKGILTISYCLEI
jgi:hypothetical protein